VENRWLDLCFLTSENGLQGPGFCRSQEKFRSIPEGLVIQSETMSTRKSFLLFGINTWSSLTLKKILMLLWCWRRGHFSAWVWAQYNRQ